MERKVEVIHRELLKDEIEIPEMEDEPRYPSPREIIDLEARIEKNQTEVLDVSENYEQLMRNQEDFIEFRNVLERSELFFNEATSTFASNDVEDNQLNFVTGVIDQARFFGFKRMLWRVTHGNIFVKQTLIEDNFKDAKSVSKLSCLDKWFLICYVSHRAMKFSRWFLLHSFKAIS